MDCRANLPELPDISDPCAVWHIAQTRPGQDAIAARTLRDMRYLIRQPIVPVTKRHRGGRVGTSLEPMFPGYVFVLQSGQSWEQLRMAPGIRWGDSALLMINGRFATILGGDPEFKLMLETEARRFATFKPETTEEHNTFRIGQRVQIKAGPWAEFCGEIEKYDGARRVFCLIEMLKRKVRARVQLEHLSLAPT